MTISLYDKNRNTVRKGENAGCQHFLLFPQCFPKPSSSGWLKVEIVWLRVNDMRKKTFENIEGKGENVEKQHFSPFSIMFFVILWAYNIISATLKFVTCEAFQSGKLKILPFGKDLTLNHTIPTFNDPEIEAF